MSRSGAKGTDSFRPSGLNELEMCGGLPCGLKRFVMSSGTSSRMLRHGRGSIRSNVAPLVWGCLDIDGGSCIHGVRWSACTSKFFCSIPTDDTFTIFPEFLLTLRILSFNQFWSLPSGIFLAR